MPARYTFMFFNRCARRAEAARHHALRAVICYDARPARARCASARARAFDAPERLRYADARHFAADIFAAPLRAIFYFRYIDAAFFFFFVVAIIDTSLFRRRYYAAAIFADAIIFAAADNILRRCHDYGDTPLIIYATIE